MKALAPVVLRAVELRRVRLPLVVPFRSAYGEMREREVLLVRVLTETGEGWGECSALPFPGYATETTDTAYDEIRDHLAPRLLERVRVTAVSLDETASRSAPIARAALESSLLDAQLTAAGLSLAQLLGARRRRVPAGVTVGLQPDVQTLLELVADYVAAGYRRGKLKIEPGWDVEPLHAVRDRFGHALALQADGNGAYRLDDAGHLARLDHLQLQCLEQPLPADEIAGHAALAEHVGTPICLDESITSTEAATAALEAGACSVVSVKPGRVGVLEARRIHDLCVERGVPALAGGMLETGVGRAAALAVAALPGFTLPGDLSASDRYFAEDLTEPFVLDSGRLSVPSGPGLGVNPRPEALDRFTTSIEVLD